MAEENPYASPDADVRVDDYDSGELAGRWRRLGGSTIDAIAVMLVIFPVLSLYDWESLLKAYASSVPEVLIGAALGIGAFLLLNGYLLAAKGQTIGKWLLNMRIVSVEDGGILSVGKVLGLRYVPQWVVSQIPLFGGLLALVNVLFIFGEQRRCVHDLLAGTKVVMTRN